MGVAVYICGVYRVGVSSMGQGLTLSLMAAFLEQVP